MEWTSEAIILKQAPFNDEKLLCSLLSKDFGLYKGLVNINKKTRNQIQIGNIVSTTWRARLPEHLGNFYCELLKPLSIIILNDNLKLSSVLSFASLLNTSLPERVCEPKIFSALLEYLLNLKEETEWLKQYLFLELELLKELGFELKLDSCAVTRKKENLYYVSPNTGHAVTKAVGTPYHKKLLLLPEIFTTKGAKSDTHILDGLILVGHFIDKWLYKQHSKEMPINRFDFIKKIANNNCITQRNLQF